MSLNNFCHGGTFSNDTYVDLDSCCLQAILHACYLSLLRVRGAMAAVPATSYGNVLRLEHGLCIKPEFAQQLFAAEPRDVV